MSWWKLGAQKGNLPAWVSEELDRADKLEARGRRGVLEVHDLDFERNPYADPRRYEIEHGYVQGRALAGRYMTVDGRQLPVETHAAGRVLSVR